MASAKVSITSKLFIAVPPGSLQAFPGVLVDDVQQPQGASVVRSCLHEVVAPHVVLALRPQAHTGAVIQPQAAPRLLFLRHLQPFPPPDPLHPIATHTPACFLQLDGDPAVAIAAVLAGHLDDRLRQQVFIVPLRNPVSLRPPPLPQQPASMPFRIGYCFRACSTAQRRRSGLRSFPLPHPSGFASPATAPLPAASSGRSLSPALSSVAPGPASARRTPCASDRTSAR